MRRASNCFRRQSRSVGFRRASARSSEIWPVQSSRLRALISSGRRGRSTTSACGTPLKSATDYCARAATLRLPTRSGANRIHLLQSKPASTWTIPPWDGWKMTWQQSKTADLSSSDISHCLMKHGGTISTLPCRLASLNCATSMPMILKPRPFWTNSPRSPRCTAATQNSTPMNSS